MTLNKNQVARDKILAPFFKLSKYGKGYLGGTRNFEGLDNKNLKILLEQNFADPEDAQNDAPTIKEFLELMTKFPQLKAHGYAVEGIRDDYRISIEGLEAKGKIPRKLQDAFSALHFADEYESSSTYLRCWFD